MEPKISIIMPAYNVEKYIGNSINCLLKQNFEDFEIIIVDDGSTDNTPAICDVFAAEDDRVKIFHKGNGGVSVARNYALDSMNGEYVTFVDSDDLVTGDYLAYLYSMITQSDNVQIAMVRGKAVNEIEVPVEEIESSQGILPTELAVRKMMLRQEFDHANWGKLYKSSLWKKVRFPSGVIYDDYDTTYRAFAGADQVAFSNAAKYFYVQRNGSLMHAECSPKTLSVLDVADHITPFMIQTWPDSRVEAVELQISTYLKNMQTLLNAGMDKYPKYQERITRKVKENAWLLLSSKKVPFKDKVKIFSLLMGKKIFLSVYNCFNGNMEVETKEEAI